jgi:hypothetical protein
MTTRKPITADDHLWTVMLPTGDTVLWDGLSMPPVKLGKHLIQTTDGWLLNPDAVLGLIPPREAE